MPIPSNRRPHRARLGDPSGLGSRNTYAAPYRRSRRTLADYQGAPAEVQVMWLADYRKGQRETFHTDLLPHLEELAEVAKIREGLQKQARRVRFVTDACHSFADELADLDAPDTPVL